MARPYTTSPAAKPNGISFGSPPGSVDSPRGEVTVSENSIYKVVFMNQGKVYEMYARSVAQSGIFGFIEIEEFLFGERSELVVDPTEETLKNEFKGIVRTNIPMHSIVRIDEVEKQGASKISRLEGGNVAQFPVPVYTPGESGNN